MFQKVSLEGKAKYALMGCCSIFSHNRVWKWVPVLCLICSILPSECKRLMLQKDEDTNLALVSDGLERSISVYQTGLTLQPQQSNASMALSQGSCEQTYGFFPCTETALGNLFLLAVYGFLMFKAASWLSDGSELLLSVMGPGIVGGLFLPVLGALPDTLLILVSGISGSKEEAQQQVVIGMGLLAGSTVMLITALWGSCLLVGKCDLNSQMVSIDNKDTKRFSLCESGVTVDNGTSIASRIMTLAIIPFIVAQIPLIFHLKSAKHISVLIACIVAFVGLFSYCAFQVASPWIQRRHLAFLKYRHVMAAILMHLERRFFGSVVDENGELDEKVVDIIFKEFDADNNKQLSREELHGLLIGLKLNEPYLTSDVLDKIMEHFDVERDNNITREEFKDGLRRWHSIAKSTVRSSRQTSVSYRFYMKTKEELDALMETDKEERTEGVENGNEEKPEGARNPMGTYMKAFFLLLAGTVVAGIFADPLVDAVDSFSSATKIPSFFISFIAMPFATNSSEAISAIIFALRKQKQTASLTFSEIYGAVTMNNTLCLGVFLAIVYMRGLDWDFSAEVLVILVAIVVTGIMGSFWTTYKLWMALIAFLMYPLSLVMVYVLDYLLGWS
eukprot:TRINITY_DN6912_c0_g1_i1.p1 TRINITY_DN6912_c0_g1~~TRINITY_DN6912_c0_g1_i1.p1  ORF type:complete len:617 (+),score=99.47 TRINITY_DN6912_c0_g1_i1:58-1908(+)